MKIQVSARYVAIILLLIFSLSFAAGGGGGGSAPVPLTAIATTYSCDGNLLIVSITSSADNSVLAGADVRVLDPSTGSIFASSPSDSNGQISATITENGKYLVSASKDGYRSNSALVFINCKKEKGLETAANASSSQIIQKETDFYCTEGKTMRERVKCYLKLTIDKVDSVKYVPEECNVIKDQQKFNKCIALYRMEQSCRKDDQNDSEREKCIKPKLLLKPELNEDVSDCRKIQNVSAKNACLADVKENVFALVKFRIYTLVYKAEELKKKGADEEKVADFITFLNQQKLKFNDAQTITEKKDIVKQVKSEWKKFKEETGLEIKK